MKRALLLLALFGCNTPLQTADEPCRDMKLSSWEDFCPHPHHRIDTNEYREICRCVPPGQRLDLRPEREEVP